MIYWAMELQLKQIKTMKTVDEKINELEETIQRLETDLFNLKK